MNERVENQRFQLPLVNIREKEDRVILTAELPGVSRDELEVTVEGDEVTIWGTRKVLPQEMKVVHRESSLSPYRRRFVLGNLIDRDRIEAKINDGILSLVLYKTKEKTPRNIEIG